MVAEAVHHPAVAVHHPAVAVHHPAVEARHPAVEARHPAVEARHPAVEARHPAVEAHHPVDKAHLPAVEAHLASAPYATCPAQRASAPRALHPAPVRGRPSPTRGSQLDPGRHRHSHRSSKTLGPRARDRVAGEARTAAGLGPTPGSSNAAPAIRSNNRVNRMSSLLRRTNHLSQDLPKRIPARLKASDRISNSYQILSNPLNDPPPFSANRILSISINAKKGEELCEKSHVFQNIFRLPESIVPKGKPQYMQDLFPCQ